MELVMVHGGERSPRFARANLNSSNTLAHGNLDV